MGTRRAWIKHSLSLDPSRYLRIRPSTKANGLKESMLESARVSRYGPMDRSMKVGGVITRQTVMDASFMQTAMSIMEHGSKIRHTDMEHIAI